MCRVYGEVPTQLTRQLLRVLTNGLILLMVVCDHFLELPILLRLFKKLQFFSGTEAVHLPSEMRMEATCMFPFMIMAYMHGLIIHIASQNMCPCQKQLQKQ